MNASENSLSNDFDFKGFRSNMSSKYKEAQGEPSDESKPGLVVGFSPYANETFGQPTDTDYWALKMLIRNMPEITAPVMRMADYTIGSSKGRPYYVKSNNELHKQITEDFFKAMKLAFVLKTSAIQLYGFGDCYLNLIDDFDKFAVISAETMRIISDKYGTVEAYIQRVLCNPTDKLVFFPSDIEHLRLIDLGSELYGFSQLESLLTAVTRLLQMENFDADFFRNNGIPRGAWMFEGMSEEEFKRLIQNVKEVQKKGAHRDLAFHSQKPGSKINYARISQTHQEMDFIEAKGYQKDKIVIGSGVPEIIQGIPDGSNRATSFTQHDTFARPVRAMQLILQESINGRVIPQMLGFDDVEIVIPAPDFRSPSEKIKDQYFFARTLSEAITKLQFTDKKHIDAIQRAFLDKMEIKIEVSPSPSKSLLSGVRGTSSHEILQIKQAEDPKLRMQSSEIQGTILGLENTVVKQINSIYEKLESKIMKLFEKESKAIDQSQYSDILKKSQKEINASEKLSKEALRASNERTYKEFLAIAGTHVEDPQKQTQFDTETMKFLNDASFTEIKGVNDNLAKDIGFELKQGIKAGEGIRQLRSRLTKIFDNNTKRAELVARTAVAEAMISAEYNQYKEAGIKTVDVILAEDSCEVCNAIASENPHPIDQAKGLLPAHPACRCDLVPS